MNALIQDFRHAFRTLRKSPGFTAAAVLTLALGIGPNTAIFSLIYGILLRPLPYQDPARLVQATWEFQRAGNAIDAVTATEYTYWAEHQRVFSGIAAAGGDGGYNLEATDQPEYVRGQAVSADLFPVLGVHPVVGRNFLAEEDKQGGPPSVIISWSLWQRRFGGASDVVARSVPLNGGSYTIVGVMPRGFTFENAGSDVWLPLRLQPNPRDQGHNTTLVARLAPGVTLKQAQADVPRMLADFKREFPGHITEGERGILLKSYREVQVSDVRGMVLFLFGAVALFALIALSNATGLFLGRAAARRQEIMVRSVLGASRGALVRTMLAEGIVHALFAGAVGLLFARWTLDLVVRLLPDNLDRLGATALNLPVLLATLALSLLIGMTIGVIPALRVSTGGLDQGLQGSTRTLGGPGQGGRSAMVVAQVALSTVLLAGAVLMVVSLARLSNVQPGFDPDGVTVVQTSLRGGKFANTAAISEFESQVIERMARLPGVRAVVASVGAPLERGLNGGVYGIKNGARQSIYSEQRIVSPGYFATLSIPIVRGRPLDGRDLGSSARVAVVNRALGRMFWGDENPIGQTLGDNGVDYEIVGVSANVLDRGLNLTPTPTIYFAQTQVPDQFAVVVNDWFLASFIIKSAQPLNRGLLDRAMADVDPSQPIAAVHTLAESTATWLAPRRLVGLLLELFAALAVVLAAVGLYGVIAFSVSRRRREIGLRMALGASRPEVLRLVLNQGLRLALTGVGIGLVGAFLSTRFLRTMLFGVQATNPLVLGAASLGLVLVALLASYLPARRAASVDPMVALRSE